MSNDRRVFRVAERIQSVIATQLLRLSDPRFFMVTISHVVVSRDLKHAKVYWVVSGGRSRIKEVEVAFESAKGVLRGLISKELGMRVSPDLRFYYDDTLDTQAEVDQIFKKIQSSS
jgi:ribosome-binding factor A